jgi:uncharacterized protein
VCLPTDRYGGDLDSHGTRTPIDTNRANADIVYHCICRALFERTFKLNVVLFGGSGLIGRHLIARLSAQGHQITLVTRRPDSLRDVVSPSVTVKSWPPPDGLSSIIDGVDAVVNLTGESIGAKRWSESRKREILSSRVDSTRAIVAGIGRTSRKPRVLLNASAVGYYGNVEKGDVTEDHAPGNDFLAEVCIKWEEESKKAIQFGMRVVTPRSGVVLAKNAEALRRMILPFRLFAGGTLGSGRQWFPWIHIDDEAAAMMHLLETPDISGPVNLVAPESVTMRQFCSALGKALHRPLWAPVPAFVLKTLLGEMADALVLGGQRAVPSVLVASGYRFTYSELSKALAEIIGLPSGEKSTTE